jgi:large subunit ribosomal protein L24e
MKCVYCGKEENEFKGLQVIHNDGSISYFCCKKCRKNSLKLKRDRKKLKWTEAYRIAKAKIEKDAKKTAEKK